PIFNPPNLKILLTNTTNLLTLSELTNSLPSAIHHSTSTSLLIKLSRTLNITIKPYPKKINFITTCNFITLNISTNPNFSDHSRYPL
ncbi:hypothetical protein VIGAN_08026100, partial [Vigna angularis var. angularis]